MKKLVLSIAVILSAATQAQTLTQASNEPSPFNAPYSTYQCDSSINMTVGSGASLTWNFSALVVHAINPKTYVSSVNTNTVYSPAYTFVNASASDNSYYLTNGGLLNYYGGNLLINSITTTLIYTSPAIVAKYPMSLNTATAAAVSGSLTINGTINGTFTGNSAVIADATGTLSLLPTTRLKQIF